MSAAAQVLAWAAPTFPGGPVTIALSGGPDSAVAAWVASRLTPPHELRAVHVDHGWDDSVAMRRAAEAVSAALGIPLTVVTVEAGASETEARTARLDALDRAAAGTAIVTGHHGGDVAETVVVNLLRGSGSAGLAGIPPVRPPFVRPLRDFPAHVVRAAADELDLPYGHDPSNDDPRHLRTRIRREVLPALSAVVPSAGEALRRTARILAADDDSLERIVARFPLVVEPHAVGIPVGVLMTQPPAVGARLVRRAIRTVHPPYAGSAADVDKVLTAIAGPAAELGGGIRCEREGPFVTLSRSVTVAPSEPVMIEVPGSVAFGPCALRVECTAVTRTPVLSRRRLRLDPDLGDRLTVRAAATGERIAIARGTKLVREAMAEAGIPRRLRPGWPVIDVHGKIAAVAGARTAAWALPDSSRDRILELTTERSSCWTG